MKRHVMLVLLLTVATAPAACDDAPCWRTAWHTWHVYEAHSPETPIATIDWEVEACGDLKGRPDVRVLGSEDGTPKVRKLRRPRDGEAIEYVVTIPGFEAVLLGAERDGEEIVFRPVVPGDSVVTDIGVERAT